MGVTRSQTRLSTYTGVRGPPRVPTWKPAYSKLMSLGYHGGTSGLWKGITTQEDTLPTPPSLGIKAEYGSKCMHLPVIQKVRPTWPSWECLAVLKLGVADWQRSGPAFLSGFGCMRASKHPSLLLEYIPDALVAPLGSLEIQISTCWSAGERGMRLAGGW